MTPNEPMIRIALGVLIVAMAFTLKKEWMVITQMTAGLVYLAMGIWRFRKQKEKK